MKKLVSTVCLLLLGSAPFAAWAEINNEQAALLKKYKCLVCHGLNNTVVGPSFADISKRAGSNDIERLSTVIRKGSVNVWSNIPMAPTKNISDDDARSLARWIAGLNPSNAVLAAREAANDFVPAAPEIFVLELSQFEPYSGPDVSKIGAAERGVDSAAFDRRRLGSVQLAPGLRVFVDKLTLPGKVEYELINALSGNAIKGANAIGARYGASEMRFTGNGVIYVTEKAACRQGGTYKYLLRGKELVLTPQALVYLGMKTTVEGDVKLFQNPDGKNEVARAPNGTEVTVIGRAPDNTQALLVRTPTGLTGWIVEGDKSGGRLLMDACD